MSGGVKVLLVIVVVLVVLLALGAALSGLRPGPTARTVIAAPSAVILAISDIPETGWTLESSGADSRSAWSEFAKYGTFSSVLFNLTLWVDADADAAKSRMDALVADLLYSTENGNVGGADASTYWSDSAGYEAGMVVRRYNVVFVIDAVSDNQYALTRFDLATWAGWQVEKIESVAR